MTVLLLHECDSGYTILLLCFLLLEEYSLFRPYLPSSLNVTLKKREKLLKEIAETNRQLKQTEKNKNATQAQLDMLRKKLICVTTLSTPLIQRYVH